MWFKLEKLEHAGGIALIFGYAKNGNDVVFRDWLFYEVLEK